MIYVYESIAHCKTSPVFPSSRRRTESCCLYIMQCDGTARVREAIMLPSESSLPIARRATWRDTECLELVCGIANAGGGRLILDADVDSRGAVKRRTSRLMKTIPGLIAQSLNLTCAVELVLDSGRFCLEVVIPPANDPISFRGIFFFYKDGEIS